MRKNNFFISFYLLISLVSIVACEFLDPTSLQATENPSQPKIQPKIAICYWGLTRSTNKVYPSHYEYLFHVLENNNIKYDVYIHTWHLNSKQRVWQTEIDVPVDYNEYKLLNPSYYQIDDQDTFTNALDFNNYFYQPVWNAKGDTLDGEWLPKLVLNHLCALESQKRVTHMVIENQEPYDLIMYIRPDALLLTPFPVASLQNLKDGDILIPNFDHCEGYNDRFAVLTYNTAPIYAKRIDGIIDFRRTQGRIVSEKYVKYICDINFLKVIFIDFTFKLIRP
jgi:hypothetical protein